MASSLSSSPGIFVERVLVADGFRVAAFSDFRIEPAARIVPLRFAGGGGEPRALEARHEHGFLKNRKIPDAPDADRVKILLHHLADAGDLPHFERREISGFHAQQGRVECRCVLPDPMQSWQLNVRSRCRWNNLNRWPF